MSNERLHGAVRRTCAPNCNIIAARPTMSGPRQERLGRYEIQALLGAGGMGQVYLAQDTNLRRQVAIKVLSTDLADRRADLHRLEKEAHAASSLNHPNILTVYEI